MKKWLAAILLLFTVWEVSSAEDSGIDSLTYAVFPYLPDPVYYQELIESRWAEIEPDIPLVRADWDCYEDGEPAGIDVIMYDAVCMNSLIEAGWIQPVERLSVLQSEDIFPFALDGLTVDGKLYGIPAFLCGNFLIYDRDCVLLAEAENITDLHGESDLLLISSDDPSEREQLRLEILADILGDPNPAATGGAEDILALIDRLAIDAHAKDDETEAALAYDAGTGSGYISFSETMRLLNRRISQTDIKAISFGGSENLPRVYLDAAAVTGRVTGPRYEKCLELMNVMAEADILTALSVQDGKPAYLLLPRLSPYTALTGQFPLYERLEELAANEENHVITTP